MAIVSAKEALKCNKPFPSHLFRVYFWILQYFCPFYQTAHKRKMLPRSTVLVQELNFALWDACSPLLNAPSQKPRLKTQWCKFVYLLILNRRTLFCCTFSTYSFSYRQKAPTSMPQLQLKASYGIATPEVPEGLSFVVDESWNQVMPGFDTSKVAVWISMKDASSFLYVLVTHLICF